MNNFKLVVVLAAIMFTACTPEKDRMVDMITEAEQNVLSDSSRVMNRKKAEDLIKLYVDFSNKYKDDTLSAEYLFRAGDLANGMGDYFRAIQYYKGCSEKINYSKRPVAFFLQGFIYENQLQDLVNARQVYTEFLQKFPDHQLVKDVRFSLENLGKSPDELIQMFQQKDSSNAVVDTAKASV